MIVRGFRAMWMWNLGEGHMPLKESHTSFSFCGFSISVVYINQVHIMCQAMC